MVRRETTGWRIQRRPHRHGGLPWAALVVASSLGVAAAQAPSDVTETASSPSADSLPRVVEERPEEWTRTLVLLRETRDALDSLLVFEQALYSSTNEERQLLRVRARASIETVTQSPAQLLDLLQQLEDAGAPVDSMRQVFRDVLVERFDIYSRVYSFWNDELNELRSQRGMVDIDQLADLELRIREDRQRLDQVLQGMYSTLTIADSLRLQTQEHWRTFDQLLQNQARDLAERLEVAVRQRDNLTRQVKDKESAGAPESDIGNDRIQLRHAERRVESLAQSLDHMVRLLRERRFDTTEYRKTKIRATGQIAEDILHPRVLLSLAREYATKLGLWLRDNLPTVLVRVLSVLVFVVLFRWLFQILWHLLCRFRIVRLPKLSQALFDGIMRPLGAFLGACIGLWFLGVNAATLLAGVGVAGVIVGLALQESLANLAAGFFILVTRPYDVDDVVKTGNVLGTVKKMGLANTTIRTFDGKRLMVPNRRIWGEVIENHSAELARRAEITVRVGYDEDLDRVLDLLRHIVLEDERVLKKPEPEIFVLDLEESWVLVAVRPWVRNQDWWPLLTELPRLVRLRFAQEGIDIPYPRSDIALTPSSEGRPAPEATGSPRK